MTNEERDQQTPTTKANCSQCGGDRNCDIRGSHKETGGDEHYSWRVHWQILQCRGCDYVFVRTISTNSEDYDQYDDENGETQIDYNESIKYWPALAKREKPAWMEKIWDITHDLDAPRLEEALTELYGALDNDLQMLAAIGIRTAFDVASQAIGIDADLTFSKKLQALVDAKKIDALDRARLEALVDAGSATAHRGWKPSPGDLLTMMDVLEHFVQTAIVAPVERHLLNEAASEVRKKVPVRNTEKQSKLA